jgi:hypothetical protein
MFVVVGSCLLRSEFIKNSTLEIDEADFLLSYFIRKVFSMRLYKLDYLLLNTFEDLKSQIYFRS